MKKCSCGKPAIHERKNEGRYYCRRCFIRKMQASVKRSMRKCGIEKGDVIAVVDDGSASGAMMWRIFSEVLGRNPRVRIVKLTGGKNFSSFTKIAMPYAREEAAALLIKSLSGIPETSGINDRRTVFPMYAVGIKEAEIYCRLLKIMFRKKKTDAFVAFVSEMERLHPGTSSQAVSFLEKIRD